MERIKRASLTVARSATILGVSAAAFVAALCAPAKTAPVSYGKQIEPILKAHCYQCHGTESPAAGLNLETQAGILKGGKNGVLFTAGTSKGCLLMKRLTQTGAARMPMGFPALSAKDLKLVSTWIDQGAKFDKAVAKHWAYVAPVKAPLPVVKSKAWVKNPIDAFVLANLEKDGLRPSAPATKEVLLRRVCLDLTGLPPTAEQQKFLTDQRPDAYERLVDSLLDSPAYGERMATPWLDLARYADTNGYEKDLERRIWPYRDWVIHAFNEDMPYDRFTTEQIAGDLVPNADNSDMVATGFNRNTMLNEEGGVDQAEQRWLTLVDRVGTTGSVFLGRHPHVHPVPQPQVRSVQSRRVLQAHGVLPNVR